MIYNYFPEYHIAHKENPTVQALKSVFSLTENLVANLTVNATELKYLIYYCKVILSDIVLIHPTFSKQNFRLLAIFVIKIKVCSLLLS